MKKNQKKDIIADNKTFAASERRFRTILSLVSVILFFGILFFFGAATVFSKKEAFSETANKYLARFPEFSGKNYFDGSFTSGIDDYVSDHFAWHDNWVRIKSNLELVCGRREQNGVYILKNRIVEKISEPDETALEKNLDGIRTFASSVDIPVYMMLVPTSAEIYADELPANAPSLDQRQFMDKVSAELGDDVIFIDVYNALMAERSNYIYYRTDHHWTTYGAYTAYAAAGKRMGYEPLTQDSFDIEHASESFKGTFYSKVLYEGIEPDDIDLWQLPEENGKISVEIYSSFGEEPAVYDSMYFRDYLSVKDKYSTFLGPNQPMVTIRTSSKGGRLLIFKDSYAHCYAPLLTSHYSEITLVDLRYIQLSVNDIIDVSAYDSVLFLYNVSGFVSDENLKKLAY